MARLYLRGLALVAVASITAYAAAFLGAREVDLSFAQFATLLTVPLLQSAVIGWSVAPCR